MILAAMTGIMDAFDCPHVTLYKIITFLWYAKPMWHMYPSTPKGPYAIFDMRMVTVNIYYPITFIYYATGHHVCNEFHSIYLRFEWYTLYHTAVILRIWTWKGLITTPRQCHFTAITGFQSIRYLKDFNATRCIFPWHNFIFMVGRNCICKVSKVIGVFIETVMNGRLEVNIFISFNVVNAYLIEYLSKGSIFLVLNISWRPRWRFFVTQTSVYNTMADGLIGRV